MKHDARMMTVRDIADRLCVSERTVRRWIASGKLRTHRLGRTVRVSDEDFRVFLAGSVSGSNGRSD